jgi:hypothetical protein
MTMILVSKKCLVTGCPSYGQEHRWEWERPTLREILAVQETLGMEPAEFDAALASAGEGITAAGAKAWLMVLTLLHRRIGVNVAYDEVDADLGQLELLPDPQATPEAEGKGTGTPTTPSPRPSGPENSSGPAPGEASAPRSSTTPVTSGSSTGSPR